MFFVISWFFWWPAESRWNSIPLTQVMPRQLRKGPIGQLLKITKKLIARWWHASQRNHPAMSELALILSRYVVLVKNKKGERRFCIYVRCTGIGMRYSGSLPVLSKFSWVDHTRGTKTLVSGAFMSASTTTTLLEINLGTTSWLANAQALKYHIGSYVWATHWGQLSLDFF